MTLAVTLESWVSGRAFCPLPEPKRPRRPPLTTYETPCARPARGFREEILSQESLTELTSLTRTPERLLCARAASGDETDTRITADAGSPS